MDIRFFGFLDVTQNLDSESQFCEAGFAQFTDMAPIQVLLDSFRQPLPDSCDYRQQEPGDSTPLVFPDELALSGYPYQAVDREPVERLLRATVKMATLPVGMRWHPTDTDASSALAAAASTHGQSSR